jgi:hypothetical protein
LRVWSIVVSGVRVRPDASPSTTKNEMPSSPLVPARRAATTIVFAVWPSITNILVPSRVYASLEPCASIVMPDASHRPFGSVNASAAMVSPAAMPGSSSPCWASLPAFMMALAANATVEKYGAHNNTRPISSSTIPSSTNVKPCPPWASGTCRLWSPSSWAICFHTASS